MIIERVYITNFKAFYKEHEIQFPGNGYGVHIIRGNNGQGKTSIVRAITWCLYGRVFDRNGKEIQPTSLLNHSSWKDGRFEFSVRIVFNHEGAEWSLFRKMRASKHSDSRYKEGMSLFVYRNGDDIPNPQQVIERMLPSGVSRYFFFDGEMLRDYEALLDESSPVMSILKEAIERILGVHYFVTARDDLLSIKRKVESERTKLVRKMGEKEFEEIGKELQEVTEDIQDLENSTKNQEKDLEDLKLEIARKMIEQADLQEVKELGNRRIKLSADLIILGREKEERLTETHSLIKNLYKIILADTAINLVKMLEIKQKAVSARYAEKLELVGKSKSLKAGIKSSTCSCCKTVLDEVMLEKSKKDLIEVEEKIKELTQVPEPNHEYEDSKTILDKMLKENVDRAKFKEIQAEILLIDHKYAIIEAEIAEISEKLGKNPQDELARNLEKEIQEMMRERGRMEQKIKDTEGRLLEYLTLKAELDRLINSIPQEEINELKDRIYTLNSIASIFDETISEYRSEKRLEVEANATEIFRKLRSKEYYDRLRINDQFGLSIITSNHKVLDKSEWRSAGEEQLVALSLIGALNKCAQIKAPVTMDTPFGRLDVNHGERVLSFLPSLSEQVILLVTDREFRNGDEKYLSGKIKSDLTVVHKGEDEGSFIFPTIGMEV